MHTNILLTTKRCTYAQSNYANTKLKACVGASYAIQQEMEWAYFGLSAPFCFRVRSQYGTDKCNKPIQ